MSETFEKMCRRTGGYSLPWLIHIYDKGGNINLYFINDTQSRTYGGKTYIASTFDYTPNASEQGFTGGGSLGIVCTDNTIIDLIETYRIIKLDVIGVLAEGNAVTEIKTYNHQYGTVSWNGKKATFTFERDDRLGMSFPALIFNHYNNRGNS